MPSPAPEIPKNGKPITMSAGRLNVPDQPIIPFIEGDGTGPDIWRASVRVFDAAVEKAYGGKRKIAWMEVFAGEKAFNQFDNWLPDETVDGVPRVSRRHQGPADHAGRRRHPLAQRRAAADARSLRLPAAGALVQGRALAGEAPGEGGHGDLPREHRGHLRRHRVRRRHAGVAEDARLPRSRTSPRSSRRSASARRTRSTAGRSSSRRSARRSATSTVEVGIGIKPVSYLGTERLVHSAIGYAIKHKRKSVTLVHKGNIMKFTEGAFRDWGYEVAKDVLRRGRDRRRPVVQDPPRASRARAS